MQIARFHKFVKVRQEKPLALDALHHKRAACLPGEIQKHLVTRLPKNKHVRGSTTQRIRTPSREVNIHNNKSSSFLRLYHTFLHVTGGFFLSKSVRLR